MADPVRPEVTLRTGTTPRTVAARPIVVGTPGASVAPLSETAQLLNSFDSSINTLNLIGSKVVKEYNEEQFKAGQLAATTNQEEWSKAVESGKVPATANPWFIKGYQNQDGRVAGLQYYSEMRRAYGESEAKGSDDPEIYQKFVTDFTKSYMAKANNKSGDWMSGFKGEMEGAQSRLMSEHASHAEAAVVAKQEANTGAEINVILNSTKDPAAAAAAINELGAKMKLMGMPSAAFEKVAAEAILAKAKLGDTGMLKALDGVKTGDGKGTLASNPKIVSARVDTENWIVEKRRGDVRWAWANDDRAWTLTQRKRSEEQYQFAKEQHDRQKAEWARVDQARSLQIQINTLTMSDPANAVNNTKELLQQLNQIHPSAAESSSGFVDAFLQRREKVPDATERPVLAQLQADMINAAGDREKQIALISQANQEYRNGKIGRESMQRFIDDAQKFGSWDVSVQRKLQLPQVMEVKRAARDRFNDGKQQNLWGTAAEDALVAEQSINRAVLDFLKTKPGASEDEVAAVATKALQSVLPILLPSISGSSTPTSRSGALLQKAEQAAPRLQTPNAADDNKPPPMPRLSADQAAQAVQPADAQEFVRAVREADAVGGRAAAIKVIAEFNMKAETPGLGEKLLELHSAPPAPPPKKK